VLRSDAADGEDGHGAIGGEPLDERRAAAILSGVRLGLEHMSRDDPLDAGGDRCLGVVGGVHARTHSQRRDGTTGVGWRHGARCELDTTCACSQSDIRAVVHDEPRSGLLLQLGDPTRQVVEAASAQPRGADVDRHAGPTGVHDATRAVDEIGPQHDVVARDGVKHRNAISIPDAGCSRGFLRSRAGHRP